MATDFSKWKAEVEANKVRRQYHLPSAPLAYTPRGYSTSVDGTPVGEIDKTGHLVKGQPDTLDWAQRPGPKPKGSV